MVKCIAGLIAIMVMSSFFVAAQDKKKDVSLSWESDADTLMSRQDFAGAIKLYDKIILKSNLKTDEDFKVLYKRAFAHYSSGNFNAALKDVTQYLQKFPDPQAKLLQLYIHQELGNTEEQLTSLNEFLSQSPGNPDLLRWRASVLMDAERYREAQQDIRTLLSFQPDPELQAYLGLSYYYLNNLDSALIIFDQIIAANPSFQQSYLYAGSLCLEEGAYPLALQYLNKGLAQNPADPTLLFYKGVALVEDKKTQEGCRCLTKAFQSGMDDAADYLKEFCYGVE